MHAILCREYGAIDKLAVADVAEPPLGAGEVLIDVHAAGINFGEMLMVLGTYQEKPPLPFTPGFEAAGVVRAIGDGVTNVKPGDRVMAALPWGGYAEVEVAAAMGARVIGAAGDADKCAVARAHGAAHTIDYHREDLRERVRALTDGRGADVVFDPVGGDAFAQALRAVAWSGRILVIGFASGSVPQIPANHVLVKNVDIMGFQWGSYRSRRPELLTPGFAHLVEWHAEGRLRPVVSHRLPLAAASEAYRLLRERRATGKIVLETRA